MPDFTSDVRARLASLRLSATREDEIVEELAQHLEDRCRELMAGGASAEDARQMALADFRPGDLLAQQMAALRQAHAKQPAALAAPTERPLAGLWQDLRHAARIFSKQRAFAAAAVLTLALGIGTTTAIFSVVYGVLLKPLSFAQPGELVTLRHVAPHGAGSNHGPATFLTYRANQRSFEAIAAWDTADVSITGRGDPERVQALQVSAAALPLLRVRPIAGRGFDPEDDRFGHPIRVILTYGYWQRRFGGSDAVVGQTLVVNGTPAEIIGILPASFTFLRTRPAILAPLPLPENAPDRMSFDFQALARLKPGVSLTQANADLGRMIALLPPAFAKLELRPDVRPLAADVIGDVGEMLWILLAAVGVVLLIACGNVANLFLVRAEARHQELATRVALGANRGRIARTLLAESIVLALAGGGAGVALAQAATMVLRAIAPAKLPRLDDIDIDATVLLFTVAVSLASGVFFGLFAVVRFWSPTITTARDGSRSGSAPARGRTRNGLVVGQIALALTLLIISGLLVRTAVATRQVDPGFVDPEHVQTFVVAIPPTFIRDDDRAGRTFENIAGELARVPGVTSVGLSSSITMDGENNGNVIEVEGEPVLDPARSRLRRFKSVAPGYFETMGNRIVAGRSISWRDIHERRPVVVVSEALAKEYWKDASSAIGKRVRWPRPGAPWREIVAVVGDERDDGPTRPATAIVYWPLLNESYRWRIMAYAVRSARVGTPGFLGELEQAVWSVDRNLPLARPETLDQIQARSMAQTSFALVMLSLAAAVALLIGVVGIYSVIAYAATQQTREIGVRMALGAQTGQVRQLFLRQGLGLAAVGIALGIGIAVMLTRYLSSLLFGVGPVDPMTYAIVSVAMTAATLVATDLPARRASRIDPIVALRADV